MTGKTKSNHYTPDMSTVTEIKEVLSQLPDGKWQKIKDWMNQRDAARQFTDDGFDIEATKTKLQAAARGKFRKWTDKDWQRLHDSVK